MENFPQSCKVINPPARDLAASKLGVSGKTAEKAAEVVKPQKPKCSKLFQSHIMGVM
ncbi:MAG: hypothetical protein AB7U45_13820 [Desulfamplus sp.]